MRGEEGYRGYRILDDGISLSPKYMIYHSRLLYLIYTDLVGLSLSLVVDIQVSGTGDNAISLWNCRHHSWSGSAGGRYPPFVCPIFKTRVSLRIHDQRERLPVRHPIKYGRVIPRIMLLHFPRAVGAALGCGLFAVEVAQSMWTARRFSMRSCLRYAVNFASLWSSISPTIAD